MKPRSCFFTAVLAATVVALLDVLWAAVYATEPVPLSALWFSSYASVGLYTPPALVLGLVQALLVDSIQVVMGPGKVRSFFRHQLGDSALDLRLGAAILGGLASLGVLCILTFAYAQIFAIEMANKRNTALSTALMAAALCPVAALFFFPGYRLARPVLALFPRQRTLVALLSLALLVVLALSLAVLQVDFRAIPLGPPKVLLAFVALQLILLWAKGQPALWRDQPLWLRRTVVLSLTLWVGSAAIYTFARFGGEPRARALIGEESALAKHLLRTTRRLVDHDKDGYSPFLGGGDCDDRDPGVHPGAEDPGGDHVDQDCDGVDPPKDVEPAASAEGTSPPPRSPSAKASFPFPKWDGNWLVITIDTLRADRIKPGLTPAMSELAQRGFHFQQVYAQAPNTPRSFPSVLTSRYPSHVHYVRQSLNFSPVTGEDPTFFSAFSQAGYRVLGIFSHFYMDPKNGLTTGFAEWKNDEAKTLHDSNTDIATPRIARRVIERIGRLGNEARKGQEKPFVLWTHLFDPHSSYMDHAEFPVKGKGMQHLEARYDAEVAYTDLWIARILQALKQAGLYERTAVVIFSDHGEAFGEHRLGGEPLYFHGETLYDEVLRVPLLLRIPGLPVAKGGGENQIPERVMLLDLAPTLLEFAHIERPSTFEGRSLVGRLYGQKLSPLPAYAEMLPCTSWQYNQRVLVHENYKLYAKFTENLMELYDLSSDPTEQHNLAGKMPDRVLSMRQMLGPYARGAAPLRKR